MKNHISILTSGLIFLVGCQTTQQASFQTSNAKSGNKNTTILTYDPQGKEEFIFNKKSEALQKYGYRNFCGSTKTFACSNRLSYSKYLGMKGYFDATEAVKKDHYGYEFYPVILENGEKYYFVINSKYKGDYGSASSIMSYKEHLRMRAFKPEPLVNESNLQVVRKKFSYGSKVFELSNGKIIPEKKLSLIREVSKRFGDNPEVAELLVDLKIEKDEIDSRFFISPKGSPLKSDVQLYIGFDESDEWLRFKVKYYDDDWLFVKSYKVAADDYRWQSPKMEFKRDHSSGSVWEWLDTSASDKELEVAKAIASADEAIIRFQGSKYYSDKTLQAEQKGSLRKIIKLFNLIKKA